MTKINVELNWPLSDDDKGLLAVLTGECTGGCGCCVETTGTVGELLPGAQTFVSTDNGTAPAGAHAGTEDVDVNGVPWNPDYHTSTKGKTQKGAWKRKNGVTEEAYNAYVAQFAAAVPPANPAAAVPPANPAAAVPPANGLELFKRIQPYTANESLTRDEMLGIAASAGITDPQALLAPANAAAVTPFWEGVVATLAAKGIAI